jgi:nicotinamide mononucleotide (NMN) deamidase PncC
MKVSLGVSRELVERHGVISNEVACDMARAVRENLGASYGIGVTGITGSEPVEDKPPGPIHIAVHDGTRCEQLSYTLNLGRIALNEPVTRFRAGLNLLGDVNTDSGC